MQNEAQKKAEQEEGEQRVLQFLRSCSALAKRQPSFFNEMRVEAAFVILVVKCGKCKEDHAVEVAIGADPGHILMGFKCMGSLLAEFLPDFRENEENKVGKEHLN